MLSDDMLSDESVSITSLQSPDSSLKDYLVSYCADAVNDNLDYIAVLQEALWLHEQAHSAWRSCLDNCPLAKRGATGQMRDDFGNAEDLVRCFGLLPHLAVDLGDVVKLLRVRD